MRQGERRTWNARFPMRPVRGRFQQQRRTGIEPACELSPPTPVLKLDIGVPRWQRRAYHQHHGDQVLPRRTSQMASLWHQPQAGHGARGEREPLGHELLSSGLKETASSLNP